MRRHGEHIVLAIGRFDGFGSCGGPPPDCQARETAGIEAVLVRHESGSETSPQKNPAKNLPNLFLLMPLEHELTLWKSW